MARRRPNPPIIHLIVAMVVVLLPALAAMAFFTRVPEAPVNVTDPAPIIQQARAEADYPIAAPQHLPQGWTCTRARWIPEGRAGLGGEPAVGDTFALGYLTPAQVYIAVDQRDRAQEELVADATRTGRRDGDSTVGGTLWQRYRSQDDRTRSLVRRDRGAVTVVSGDLPYEALEAFVGTLAFS